MKAKKFGSIYQGTGSSMGLDVQGGLLVNNRPDGMTGIQHLAMSRKMIKHENKVNTYAEGMARGERMSEVSDMMSGLMGLKNC